MNDVLKIAKLVNLISRKIQAFHDDDKEVSNISLKQLYYLDTIHRMHEPSVTELAKQWNITKPSVTVIIEKMEKDQIIIKVPSETDKRSFWIKLSDKGQRLQGKHDEMYNKAFGMIERMLNQGERHQLRNIIRKIADKMLT